MRDMQSHDVHLHYFLRPDHWDVADLWVSNWSASMPALGFNARHDWLFDHLETLHENGSATVCAVNTRSGGIAGFVTVNADTGRLEQIVVASTARGSGVAGKLMEEARRIRPEGLDVEVEPDNERALRFFAREGFAPVEAASADAPVRLRWRGPS